MIIETKVITNAKNPQVIKINDGFYKIKVVSVAEKGKANDELIKLLSQKFNVAKSKIEIIKGLTSSKKLIKIE